MRIRMQALGESGSKHGGAPTAAAAGARDVDEWVARVEVLEANASVPVVARGLPMSAVSRAMSFTIPSVAPP